MSFESYFPFIEIRIKTRLIITHTHNSGKILIILRIRKSRVEYFSSDLAIKNPLRKKNTGTPLIKYAISMRMLLLILKCVIKCPKKTVNVQISRITSKQLSFTFKAFALVNKNWTLIT